jgi:Trk-type K+ transport system membrane component
MNIFLFIITILISFIAVRFGAIAFEMTGLEWSLAKFQALSCFSGTGFTTKEAELVVGHPQRRKIASVLMVLGNAGIVTLIATFANSLSPNTIIPKFKIPFIDLLFPAHLLPLVNLVVIVTSTYTIYRLFNYRAFLSKLTTFLRKKIMKREIIKPVSFEELFIAAGNYGVSSVDVCSESPAVNKTLAEANLRKQDITVLAVERNDGIIPNPSADTKIMLEDRLICFGKLENIRKSLCNRGD